MKISPWALWQKLPGVLILRLILLAGLSAPAGRALAAETGRRVFSIADYGAKNDGSAPATDAFRRAIAAAKAAGGGTILVPAGKYSTGPIELFSNMTLAVDAGAVIAFPVAALPFTKGRYLGIETLVPMPLIGGTEVENVTITGRGILTTADYESWRKAYPAAYAEYLKVHHGVISTGGDESAGANGPRWDHLVKAIGAKKPVSENEYRAAAAELRPSFVCFMNAKNVLVEGVRFVGAPMFVVHLLYAENATVRHVMIETWPCPHTNGIVADSSRFIRISDCYVDTGDDGIVIKSGKDADGLRVNRPSEDITITNCTVRHAHGAVVIGSETAGGVRNVVASNITATDTETGIRIKSRRGRGGVVENIRFDNWTMENVGTGIVVTSHYVMGGESATHSEPVSERTPVLRNIAISHITINGANKVVEIDGLPEMPVTALRLDDIVGIGQTGLTARHTEGLELRHLRLDADRGPAFAIDDASSLELDDVTTVRPVAGAPVLRLTHAPGAVLRNCRAFPGTDIFLSAGPGELKTLHLAGNILTNARIPAEESPRP